MWGSNHRVSENTELLVPNPQPEELLDESLDEELDESLDELLEKSLDEPLDESLDEPLEKSADEWFGKSPGVSCVGAIGASYT